MDEEERRRLELAYRAHGSELWKAIRSYSGSSQIADDAVAESFARAAGHMGRIRDERRWLFTVAFRLARQEMMVSNTTSELPTDAGAHDPEFDHIELLEELEPLSHNQRAVLVFRELLRFSTHEVASITGMSEVAVRVHLHRARRRLRETGGSGG